MEKKLKFNFILKGIAIFAFVAFCLLAILAGVTLPFVSNARTVDCAVANAQSDFATASANSDFNYLDYSIPLSQCNTTDTYYGFFFTDDFINTLRNADLVVNGSYIFAVFDFINVTNDEVMLLATAQAMGSGKFNYVLLNSTRVQLYGLSADTTMYSPSIYISENGFKFSSFGALIPEQDIYNSVKDSIYVFNQLPFGGDTTELENQIATLTAEKNALQTQVNNLTDENNNLKKTLGFKSRFGFIGDLKNNQMFLSTKNVPKIPDEIYCPYRNDSLVNYKKIGNDYYLSIVDAYDSNNNVVTDSFSGWKFINIKNPDGTPSSFYDFEFFIRDLRIAHIDTVEFVNNCFSTPNYNNIYYLVSTGPFPDDAYGISKSQYLYSLCSYLNKDDVRDFFALFDYNNYVPVNDAFYLEGYNNASKGYFDDGYKKGYSVGKDEGYNTGFNAGDAQGFARGVDSANTYSFLGLFGAIFDAPIKAIFGGTSTLPAGTTITDSNGNTITLQSTTTVNRAGLLNFNLMGVNLSGFVLALFSLSILVVVIKFALAKGR